MKVLVCGSRGWGIDLPDPRRPIWDRLNEVFEHLAQSSRLITGGARGPDEFARQWAADSLVDHLVCYADWATHGKRAGILRNLRMLDEKPDLVLAFWDGTSRGTKHTIDEAHARGITVELHRSDA